MKAVSFSSATNMVVLALVACMPVLAGAATQSVIASAVEPYLAKPEIKFVIDVVEAKPAETRAASPAPSLEVFLSPPVEVITPPIDVAVPATPALVWTLAAGRTVGQELKAWGEKADWKVIWSMPKDWSVPASTSFSGDFQTAAGDVIKTLAANGALVHAQFYEGNKTMVVTGPGVAAQ
jgi:hypothetical protein